MTKKYRPVTPGRRQLVLPTTKGLSKPTKNAPYKPALVKKNRSSGRNNQGHLTSNARGGGHKRRYRQIDFKRTKDGIPAKVLSIEYDPNRSAHIALLAYADGEKRYILSHKGAAVGDTVHSGAEAPIRNGNTLPMVNMPIGAVIHNIEITPGKGGQMVRSAGLSAQLMARSGGYVTLKMPSGEVRMVRETCRATIGQVSNEENNLRVEGKAGRARWLGWRPRSRGVVTNPVDGTMGGGEGRHKGHVPRSRTGVPSKGFKTRSKKKSKRLIVKDRRK